MPRAPKRRKSKRGSFLLRERDDRVRSHEPIRLSDVLELPIAERLKLVEAMWDSIAEVPEAIALTEEQRAELDRRLAEYEKGPGGGSPWPEVKGGILEGS